MTALQQEASLCLAGKVYGEELSTLLDEECLVSHFQPILDMRALEVYGWEALIRVPAESPLASPHLLFAAARAEGQLTRLDYACRKVGIAAFARQKQRTKKGRLFLNVEPTALIASSQTGKTAALLAAHGLRPHQVVIELTEATPNLDYATLVSACMHYRQQGFAIAIDDLGEGFSSLRLWSELRPDYVKIDRHFIARAPDDHTARRFLESVVSLSQTTGSIIIAEGIENKVQLDLVRQLGVQLVQGFLFASPSPELICAIPESKRNALLPQTRPLSRTSLSLDCRTVEALIEPVETVSPEATNEDIFALFNHNPRLYAIAVVDNDARPLGLVLRNQFLEDFAQPFRRELFGRKSCIAYLTETLIVPATTSLRDITSQFQTLDLEQLGRPFIVTTPEGRYRGLTSGQSLLREIVSLQLQTARYANPLTGLPGNIPINETLDLYLARRMSFVAAYLDISNFKAFNDQYGFMRGDEMIQLVAELMRRHVHHPDDFIGHIGGDDFIILWVDPEWQKRVQSLFDAYATALPAFYTPEDWVQGGINAEDRQGNHLLHPVSALTIGVLPVEPDRYSAHQAIGSAASAAKKMAKQKSRELARQGMKPANALFIELRRTSPSQ
ncbi:MAG: bifunctional diguanylate cyclase/phosphodiesterase [Rhodocyclaceae bacterium]|nr:bifunctional diguanylate cyclase/phosphodiesterase [Rhodocyclaceae bacterium]